MYRINKKIRIRKFEDFSLWINICNNRVYKIDTKISDYILEDINKIIENENSLLEKLINNQLVEECFDEHQ